MSNAIVRQTGDGSVVADNIWQFRLGAVPLVLGLVAGASAALLAARALGRARRAPDGPPPTSPPTPRSWPVVFAHRGGRYLVPEDTVEGFAETLRRFGDVVLELDVHATADGVVVVLHDDTVDRTTDGTGAVAEMTLAELQELDAGYRFSPDGRNFPWRGRGVRVPTLAEVYRQFPGRPVNVEVKGGRSGIEEAVWRVVEAAGAADRTLVVTTSGAAIRRFRRASGNRVATAASVGEFVLYRALGVIGLADLQNRRFQALQPPDTWRGVRVTTPGLVRRAHDDGLRVDVWTVDEEADVRRLLGWGVDGIMTDRPDVLARVLGRVPA
ncbi:glycerophosphodiester phosphodiesterase [Kineococcus sp. SYSU DK003]|uniref:glycerophosphodiester phosphodiesterase n=1 Tax=Kineococcus sp. SYSU DK003 TaxID=3383124 RepID=UPI003D7E5F39